MTASRRPDRRPPARAAAGARRARRGDRAPARAGRAAAASATPARRAQPALTTRAAVLGAASSARLVVSAALPLREYLAQRGEIGELEQQQARQRERVEALEARSAQLEDPAYVAAEARRRLHFVLPGETAYVVLAPGAGAGAAARRGGAPAAGPEAPWYSQLWGSVAGGRPARGPARRAVTEPRPARPHAPSACSSAARPRAMTLGRAPLPAAGCPTSSRPSRGSTTARRSRRSTT